MWHLPEAAQRQCEVGADMLRAAMGGVGLRQACCVRGGYVEKRPQGRWVKEVGSFVAA